MIIEFAYDFRIFYRKDGEPSMAKAVPYVPGSPQNWGGIKGAMEPRKMDSEEVRAALHKFVDGQIDRLVAE